MAATNCAAVYPIVDTPLRTAPPDVKLDPPPPSTLYYLAIKGGTVPPRTRGNEKWDELGDGAPDPFVKLFLNDELLFTTSTEQDSYNPKWADSPRKNWDLPRDSVLRVEMWNSNAVNDQVICIDELDRLEEQALEGPLLAKCEGGAAVEIELHSARPKFGLGFRYELRQGGAAIHSVLEQSPAERAGVLRGEFIDAVNGKSTRGMSAGELQTMINMYGRQGLKLTLRAEGSAPHDVEVKEGPIYSLPLD